MTEYTQQKSDWEVMKTTLSRVIIAQNPSNRRIHRISDRKANCKAETKAKAVQINISLMEEHFCMTDYENSYIY